MRVHLIGPSTLFYACQAAGGCESCVFDALFLALQLSIRLCAIMFMHRRPSHYWPPSQHPHTRQQLQHLHPGRQASQTRPWPHPQAPRVLAPGPHLVLLTQLTTLT